MQGALEKKTTGSKWVNVECVLEGQNLAAGEGPMAVLQVIDVENRVRNRAEPCSPIHKTSSHVSVLTRDSVALFFTFVGPLCSF